MKSLLLAGAGALMLGSLAIPASAAPAVGGLKTTAAETSAVDRVNYRRCWHRHGHLVCRRGYRYGYAPYYDDGYYGYGYGPGVGLYFGGVVAVADGVVTVATLAVTVDKPRGPAFCRPFLFAISLETRGKCDLASAPALGLA